MKYVILFFLFLASCSFSGKDESKIDNAKSMMSNDDFIFYQSLTPDVVKKHCEELSHYRNNLKEGFPNQNIFFFHDGYNNYSSSLQIVYKYKKLFGEDEIFHSCVKLLYFFDDGEYAGLADYYFPEQKHYASKHHDWLLHSPDSEF